VGMFTESGVPGGDWKAFFLSLRSVAKGLTKEFLC